MICLNIKVRGIVKLNSFKIFNRWGQLVYETTNINEGWNGQFNGKPQPMGVYVYAIDATTSTGKKFVKQGNVTLVR
jgi:gliding motility-associated-like protein